MSKDNIFSSEIIMQVWGSIDECAGRKECIDPWGLKINRHSYGCSGEFCWNIDHIIPVSDGGTNDLKNLQPLNWRSNEAKSNNKFCHKWVKC